MVKFVKGQRRNQANHSAGNAGSDGHKVRVAQGRVVGKKVHAAAHHHQCPGVAHAVDRAGVDSRTKSLCRAEEATVLLEDGDRPVIPGTWLFASRSFTARSMLINL